MKLPKLSNLFKFLKGRNKKIMVASIIFMAFFFSSPYLLSTEDTKSIFDYGAVLYQTHTLGTYATFKAGDTINSLLSDIKITFTWNTAIVSAPEERDFHVILWNGWANQVEDVYSTKSGNVFTFNFGLLNAFTGTNDYYFTLYATRDLNEYKSAYYQGNSFGFKISNILQITDAPSWIEVPADIPEAVIGFPESLSWKFKYSAACSGSLYQDDVLIDSRDFAAGNVFTQEYSYTYNPTVERNYVFKFTLTPETTHSAISDSMNVGVISFEEFGITDGMPPNTACSIDIKGTIAMIGLEAHNVWNASSDAPTIVPLDGKLYITLHTWNYDGAKIVLTSSSDGTTEEIVLRHALGTWWNEVDLGSYADGEYQVEVLVNALGSWWRISTFSISVRTIPYSFLLTILVFVGVFSIGSVFVLKMLREAKGWWSFQGNYNK